MHTDIQKYKGNPDKIISFVRAQRSRKTGLCYENNFSVSKSFFPIDISSEVFGCRKSERRCSFSCCPFGLFREIKCYCCLLGFMVG